MDVDRLRGGSRRLDMSYVVICMAIGCFSTCAVTNTEDGEEKTPAVQITAPIQTSIVNDEWQILKMATAHGVMTIEVEIENLERSLDVAKALTAPLLTRYSEILIYVYAHEEGIGGFTPVERIQWTSDLGYSRLSYE